MASKEGIFIILDVGKTMSNSYGDSEQTRLEFGIESIKQIVRQKFLFNVKQDQVGIILLNKNLQTHTELHVPNIEFLSEVEKIKCSNSDEREDITCALMEAHEKFYDAYKDKKWGKKIFLITDGEGEVKSNKSRNIDVAKMLEDYDVKVNVICVDFYNELDDDEEEEDEEQGIKKEKIPSKDSENQCKTKELLETLVDNTDNVKVFTATTANHIYHQFKKKKVNPVAKYRGPLVISPNLSIDINIYMKTTPSKIPSLSKYSKVSEYSEEPGLNKVETDRVFYIHDDPDKKEVDKELITKAYYYGSSLVPVSKTDEKLFKIEEERCLKTIGFTDNYRVPRHFYMSGVDIVVPNPASESDCKAFKTIVKEMLSMNKVIIARYIARANAQPRLAVLTPHLSKKGPVLYLNILPTVEDIRDFQFDSLPECSKEQENFLSGFIDSLDLDEDEVDPTETYNPMLQYFYQCLEAKALQKASTLPPLNEEQLSYLLPNKEKFENNKYVQNLNKVFPIQKNETENIKKKRVFWKDVIKSEFEAELTQEALEQKLKDKKPEAKKNISAITPIEDFNEMISNKNEDLVVRAMELMSDLIRKFIRESFKGSYFIKAIDCIKAYRDAANEEDEVENFNVFLNDLKIKFPKDQYLDFWMLLCDNKITLISKSENEKSTYSQDQCNEWIDEIKRKEVIASTVSNEELGNLLLEID